MQLSSTAFGWESKIVRALQKTFGGLNWYTKITFCTFARIPVILDLRCRKTEEIWEIWQSHMKGEKKKGFLKELIVADTSV